MNARELQSLANLEWDMVIDVRGSHPTDDAQREHAIALLRDLPRRHQITAIDEDTLTVMLDDMVKKGKIMARQSGRRVAYVAV